MKISVLSISPPAAVSKNWMKWKKMEIITQQREKKMMLRGATSWPQATKAARPHCNIRKYLTIQSQHKLRDPFVYLSINEGNETGNLILGLCFPMVPIAADRAHLETGENGDGRGRTAPLRARVRRAGCLLQLGRLAGYHATR